MNPNNININASKIYKHPLEIFEARMKNQIFNQDYFQKMKQELVPEQFRLNDTFEEREIRELLNQRLPQDIDSSAAESSSTLTKRF